MNLLFIVGVVVGGATFVYTAEGEEDLLPKADSLRQFGPYGRRDSNPLSVTSNYNVPHFVSSNSHGNSDSSSKYGNSQFSDNRFRSHVNSQLDTRGSARTEHNTHDQSGFPGSHGNQDYYDDNDFYEQSLQELYKNHRLDGNEEYQPDQQALTDQAYQHNDNNNNNFHEQNSGEGFNGSFTTNRGSGNSGGVRSLQGSSQRWGYERGQQYPQQDLTRRLGTSYSGNNWGNIHRSDMGYGGGGGAAAMQGSIDIYSILALGMFALFIGYIVFYALGQQGARSLVASPDVNKLTRIWGEVTDAVERWAIYELLPKELLELGEEEEEEDNKEEEEEEISIMEEVQEKKEEEFGVQVFRLQDG